MSKRKLIPLLVYILFLLVPIYWLLNMSFKSNTEILGGLTLFPQDFTLANATGVEINAVYVSPSEADHWGKDILGKDTLPDGEEADIEFSPEEESALWDLKIEDKEGNAIIWTKLNLTEISTLTLHWDADTKKATAEAE